MGKWALVLYKVLIRINKSNITYNVAIRNTSGENEFASKKIKNFKKSVAKVLICVLYLMSAFKSAQQMGP